MAGVVALETAAELEPASHALAVVESWAQTIAAPNTRRAYRGAVLLLLSEHGSVDPSTLAAWRDAQLARGLARSTVRPRMAAVRSFAAWAQLVGALEASAVSHLASVQSPSLRGDYGPRALLDPQVRLMDRVAGAVWPDDPLRVAQARATVRTLSSCGPRVAELHNALLSDLVPARPMAADRAELAGRDVAGYALRIEGKGARRRVVPVPTTARKAVHALHDLAGTRRTPGAALIPALTTHRPARLRAPERGIATRTVEQLITRLARAVNEQMPDAIDPTAAYPHALRHGYALRYLRDHPDGLGRLRVLLGHSNIATTARYLAAIEAANAPDPSDPWRT